MSLWSPITLVLLLVISLALALPLPPFFFQLKYLVGEVLLLEEVVKGSLSYSDVLSQDSKIAGVVAQLWGCRGL